LTSILENKAKERMALISEIRLKGISNQQILDALSKIPRELFLDKYFEEKAYNDVALPIGYNQTISQPYTVAFMTDLLDLSSGMRVLEIGTGSGYQAILFAMMGAQVYTIERIADLLNRAQKKFDVFNLVIHSKLGDGSLGWVENAPYDRIMITAGVPEFPYHLKNQLTENGILVCPVGNRESQKMYKSILRNGKFENDIKDNFKFVPLIGEYGWNEKV